MNTRKCSMLLAFLALCVMVVSSIADDRLSGPQSLCVPAKSLGEALLPPAYQTTTLEGRVVFKGIHPAAQPFPLQAQGRVGALVRQAQQKGLLEPTVIDPKTKGVANVVMFLKRPVAGRWPIEATDKTRKEAIVMDAPLLAFEPRVIAYYPEWFDGKDRGATGQEFVIKNSSPVPINVRATGDPKITDGFNRNLLAKLEFNATKDLRGNNKLNAQRLPVAVQNDVHTWMRAYVFVFDHPYYAITKADGTFTIPRVPAGMDVQVMAWHEAQGWLLTKDGKTMTLNEGKNMLDFEMSAK